MADSILKVTELRLKPFYFAKVKPIRPMNPCKKINQTEHQPNKQTDCA